MTSESPLHQDLRPLVLLVEDDDGVRRSLQMLLTGCGYRVKSFAAATPALADPASMDVTLLVADYRLPDSDGLNLLQSLREKGWQGRAVLVTAFPSGQLADAARDAGFDTVIEKPLRQHALLAALASAN